MLQPFLKRAAVVRQQRRQRPEQDQPRATTSYADACSKLDEAVALVDTLGCEVVLKEVGRSGRLDTPSSFVHNPVWSCASSVLSAACQLGVGQRRLLGWVELLIAIVLDARPQ